MNILAFFRTKNETIFTWFIHMNKKRTHTIIKHLDFSCWKNAEKNLATSRNTTPCDKYEKRTFQFSIDITLEICYTRHCCSLSYGRCQQSLYVYVCDVGSRSSDRAGKVYCVGFVWILFIVSQMWPDQNKKCQNFSLFFLFFISNLIRLANKICLMVCFFFVCSKCAYW